MGGYLGSWLKPPTVPEACRSEGAVFVTVVPDDNVNDKLIVRTMTAPISSGSFDFSVDFAMAKEFYGCLNSFEYHLGSVIDPPPPLSFVGWTLSSVHDEIEAPRIVTR